MTIKVITKYQYREYENQDDARAWALKLLEAGILFIDIAPRQKRNKKEAVRVTIKGETSTFPISSDARDYASKILNAGIIWLEITERE